MKSIAKNADTTPFSTTRLLTTAWLPIPHHIKTRGGSLSSNIADRVKLVNDKPINEAGEFVLYWMIYQQKIQ